VPKASGMKFHYLDHDTDAVVMTPPVQNTWYEVFHDYDVRLLWCVVSQSNTEAAAKDIEARWTIDGNVYFKLQAAASGTGYRIFRSFELSAGGTNGLTFDTVNYNAGRFVDKRGHDFKVEIRITSALGTNQILTAYCVRETLELT